MWHLSDTDWLDNVDKDPLEKTGFNGVNKSKAVTTTLPIQKLVSCIPSCRYYTGVSYNEYDTINPRKLSISSNETEYGVGSSEASIPLFPDSSSPFPKLVDVDIEGEEIEFFPQIEDSSENSFNLQIVMEEKTVWYSKDKPSQLDDQDLSIWLTEDIYSPPRKRTRSSSRIVKSSSKFGTIKPTSKQLEKLETVFSRSNQMSYKTEEEWIFPCSVKSCSKMFKNEEKLKRHIISIHTDYRAYRCEICDNRFSRSDNLQVHSKKHRDGR